MGRHVAALMLSGKRIERIDAVKSMTALAIPDYQNGSASDYFQLLKPRVMSLVVFTGLAGMVIAPGGFLGGLHPVLAFTALLCIAVGSGAAGAINMWYDRDIDAKMERTKARPLPAGRMEAGEVLGFGVTLSVFSVIIMGLAVNILSAALLAAAILFYVFVYTIGLKTPHPAKYRDWRRGGGFPTGDWLGGGNRFDWFGADYLVFADIFMDTAAFLGFGLVSQRRI